MSAHPNARPACAYIQGHIVNVVSPESPEYNPKYDSIYNHGYGTPAGTLGINCRHVLTPYTPGINTNNQPQYDPEEAIKRGNLQQQQRAYERAIRQAKKKLLAAQYADEKDDVSRFKTLLLARQKRLRQFIKDANKGQKVPVLARDYAREQVAPNTAKQVPKLSKLSDKKSEKRYNMCRKVYADDDESDNPPTLKEFADWTRKFRQRGGKIITSGPDYDFLEFKKSPGVTHNANEIVLGSRAGKAALREELIHAEQLLKNPNPSDRDLVVNEIEAKKQLLAEAKEMGYSEKENRHTREWLEYFQKLLEKKDRGR